MKPSQTSRRSFLQGAAGALGASLFASRRGLGLFPRAEAQAAAKSAVVLIHLRGGYNALFGSADSFVAAGTFGSSASSVLALTNGLVVDKATLGSLPAPVLAKMASIGVRHGISGHAGARAAEWHYMGTRSYPILLAGAMGGTASIKCANIGAALPDEVA